MVVVTKTAAHVKDKSGIYCSYRKIVYFSVKRFRTIGHIFVIIFISLRAHTLDFGLTIVSNNLHFLHFLFCFKPFLRRFSIVGLKLLVPSKIYMLFFKIKNDALISFHCDR